MSQYTYTISLRVVHPVMKPEKITKALGMTPQTKWTVGEARRSISGKLLGGHNKESFWCSALRKSDDSDFHAFLIRSIESLKTHREFFKAVRAAGGRLDLYVSLQTQSCIWEEMLTSEAMLALGQMGLDLIVDVLYDTDKEPSA